MSQSDRDREDRAFEALIVSQFRRERDCCDLNDLPELNDEELTAMKGMPDDLVGRLWEQVESQDQESSDDEDDEYASMVDEDLYVGMNRADGPTDETQTKLDEARKEVLDQLKKAKRGKESGNAKP
jgi:hypothetical protein